MDYLHEEQDLGKVSCSVDEAPSCLRRPYRKLIVVCRALLAIGD